MPDEFVLDEPEDFDEVIAALLRVDPNFLPGNQGNEDKDEEDQDDADD